MTTRKRYSPKVKARVAIEAMRGEKTLSQLGSHFKVHRSVEGFCSVRRISSRRMAFTSASQHAAITLSDTASADTRAAR